MGLNFQVSNRDLNDSRSLKYTWARCVDFVCRVKNRNLFTLSGTFIMFVSFVLAGFSARIWHLYLTQVLLFGLGTTLFYHGTDTARPKSGTCNGHRSLW
ncbi:hypothetical protein ACEPAG_7975 [Sanghuangporus baumii]